MSKLDIEAARIRLRRILAGYRYFFAHAKAILHLASETAERDQLPSGPLRNRGRIPAQKGVFRYLCGETSSEK